MRILYVSNSASLVCGVGNYGRQCVEAAKRIGLDITDWDAVFPKRLPPDAAEYDRIHLNWHPGTIGHLQEVDVPRGPRLSVFLHEPDCTLPEGMAMRADALIAAEPRDGMRLFLPPCPDYRPVTDWAHQPPGMREIVIGLSSIRKSGLDRLAPAVERYNRELRTAWVDANGPLLPYEVLPDEWHLATGSNSPDGWLSDEAEVERLAQCTLNVAHYHGANQGQATGVMTAIAARRPVLINSNRMLENLFDEPELYRIEDVRDGIERILHDIRDGCERRPLQLAEKRSWGRMIWQLKEVWGA